MSFKARVLGYVGRDAELRTTSSGTQVADFSIASTSKEKEKDVTTWIKVTAWGKQAEFVGKYVKKGGQFLVEGEMKPEIHIWTNDKGETRASYEMTLREIEFAGGKKDSQASDNGHSAPVAQTEPVLDESEIPF